MLNLNLCFQETNILFNKIKKRLLYTFKTIFHGFFKVNNYYNILQCIKNVIIMIFLYI